MAGGRVWRLELLRNDAARSPRRDPDGTRVPKYIFDVFPQHHWNAVAMTATAHGFVRLRSFLFILAVLCVAFGLSLVVIASQPFTAVSSVINRVLPASYIEDFTEAHFSQLRINWYLVGIL